jgi:hypothetical protein
LQGPGFVHMQGEKEGRKEGNKEEMKEGRKTFYKE